MGRLTLIRAYFLAAAGALATAAGSRAALPIELEVAVQGDAPIGVMQEWNRVLVEMDLTHVRLRGARAGDEPKLDVRDVGGDKRYVLVGVINRRDELVLPGGMFRQSQRAALQEFFEGLPRREAEAQNEGVPFSLAREEFLQVLAAMSRPFNEPTRDGAPHELVAALTADVELPVEGDVAMRARLRDADPFRGDLKGRTRGTVLAAVLRSAGLQFAPDKLGQAPLTLRVVPLDPATESWPVGWKPVDSPKRVSPGMYTSRNIEISDFTAAAALDALTAPMGMPIVLDQRVVKLRNIDPATVQVKFPGSKTHVKRVVDFVLNKLRLSGELRVDEAGQPFYWATSFGPDSARATVLTLPEAKASSP